MNNLKKIVEILRRNWQTFFISTFILAFAILLGTLFFVRSRELMEQQLRDTLRLNVSLAAEQFEAENIEAIQGRKSMKSNAFKKVVSQLSQIRKDVPQYRFVYIMRYGKNPTQMEFVADADSLASDAELDVNKNGQVDDDERASYPGDPYDLLQAPSMIEGFSHPTVDDEIAVDQWGHTISAYAPIRNAKGEAIAILGVDMVADQFLELTHRVFSPVAYMLFCITAVLLAGYLVVFLWQRKLEALKRIDQERSGVMLLTFHQLGTPLTICRWSLETLLEAMQSKDQPIEEAVKEHSRNLQAAMKQLKSVLDSLHEASLVDAGQLEYRAETTCLDDLIRSIVSEFNDEITRKNRTINLHLRSGVCLPIDRTLVGGAIRELVTNALCYSPQTSPVDIELDIKDQHAIVRVLDRGAGITREDQSRIFNKFVRGRNAALYRPDGSGLGLYVVKGIVERAGGEIFLESVEGRGTIVTFTLPLQKKE